MVEALRDNRSHMIVLKRVIDRLSVPSRLYQVRVFERLQLMRNRGLRHAQIFGYRAYAHFAFRKHIQYPHARRIAKEIEKIRKMLPAMDCGACGCPTCSTLAEDIVKGKASITDCVVLLKEQFMAKEKED